jgi:CBS-domain-containing membrane protein
MATVSLIIIFLLEDAVLRAAIVVAVASTAFIIFVIPNSVAAEPKRIIGGHFMAVVTGVICWWVLTSFGLAYTGDNPRIYIDLAAAISVGLALLLMVSTNTEHPPAAGTALGLVIHGVTWDSVAFILASAIVFSIIRTALRSRLINLL